jgi:hypothetical protein
MAGLIKLEDVFDDLGVFARSFAFFNWNRLETIPIHIVFLDQII